MNGARTNIRQAAEQLTNYLLPKGSWIGTTWINGMVLEALAHQLEEAVLHEKKLEQEARETAGFERSGNPPVENHRG